MSVDGGVNEMAVRSVPHHEMHDRTSHQVRCATNTPALAEGTGVADAAVGRARRGRHLGLAAGLCEFGGCAVVAGAEMDG
jgi:hypothetical protein